MTRKQYTRRVVELVSMIAKRNGLKIGKQTRYARINARMCLNVCKSYQEAWDKYREILSPLYPDMRK